MKPERTETMVEQYDETVDAMIAAYNAEFNHTNNAFKRPMRAALNELLARGWRRQSTLPDVDTLAQIIRHADSSNKLGAGALAEAILAVIAEDQRATGDRITNG